MEGLPAQLVVAQAAEAAALQAYNAAVAARQAIEVQINGAAANGAAANGAAANGAAANGAAVNGAAVNGEENPNDHVMVAAPQAALDNPAAGVGFGGGTRHSRKLRKSKKRKSKKNKRSSK